MNEADKIIKNLKNSGKKVEEFYMSNKTSDKNVANEERLNNFIEAYKQTKEQSFIVDSINKDFFFEFVDCLLAEREQKDKQIQELEEEKNACENEIQMHLNTIKEYDKKIKNNYIPTQVVIDKLDKHKFAYEELGKILETKHYENEELKELDFNLRITEDRIVQILQELLEGEK